MLVIPKYQDTILQLIIISGPAELTLTLVRKKQTSQLNLLGILLVSPNMQFLFVRTYCWFRFNLAFTVTLWSSQVRLLFSQSLRSLYKSMRLCPHMKNSAHLLANLQKVSADPFLKCIQVPLNSSATVQAHKPQVTRLSSSFLLSSLMTEPELYWTSETNYYQVLHRRNTAILLSFFLYVASGRSQLLRRLKPSFVKNTETGCGAEGRVARNPIKKSSENFMISGREKDWKDYSSLLD